VILGEAIAVTTQTGLTALVLAGSRAGGDPLAVHAGVTHKALIDVGGQPMLQRVVDALAAVAAIHRIIVIIERPQIVAALRPCGKPIEVFAAQSGPSASAAAALQQEGAPLLVTTADHALLQPAWVEEFLAAPHGDADALLALARRDAVLAAAPESQRTWLQFSDDHYSGCNLFLLRTAAAAGVLRFWQEMEAARKRPLAMLSRLGFSYVLRYRFGWLSLPSALRRLGALSGTKLRAVVLTDGRAAIDVDKPADLTLVRKLVGRVG
jgi:GTP:adenosylcobinamide-phosphate guanylyltransferase